MRDGAAADPGVDGGGGRGGQLARQFADGAGVHVAGRARRLGSEVPERVREFVGPLDVRCECAEVDELLLEEDVRHRREEGRVGAGADGHVAVGELGRSGPARVDDGERAAAGPQCPEPAGEVGGGAQTPVGLQRVGADEEQVVGVVQVRDGDRVGVAVQQAARHVLGHLVDGGGGEHAAGAQRSEQDRRIEGAGHGVHVRVAEDDTDRVRPVPLDHGAQPGGDRVEGLLPGGLAQLAVLADERGAQPVGVAVGRSEGGALRADEPLAEHVVAVAAGAGDPGALDRQREPAGGLTEGADAYGGTGVGGTAGGAGHGSSRRAVTSMARGHRRAYRPVRTVGRDGRAQSRTRPR